MVNISPPPDSSEGLPDWLASFTNWEKQLPLDRGRREWGPLRCRKLLDRAGLETHSCKVIQVAGSKGKGSTVLWLEALLSVRGCKTAALTSPHLISLEERIRTCRHPVPFEKLLAGLHRLYPALLAGQAADDPLPTFFDLWTALYIEIALKEGVSHLLLEVGLGGPLDSTTAIPHDVGILTTIDLEHTTLLGDTCEKIAAEKSKIARDGKPLLIASGETSAVSAEIAASRGAIPVICDRDPRVPEEVSAIQSLNASLALRALDCFWPESPMTPEETTLAWNRLELPGRLEVVPGPPELLLDGAHTPASISAFVEEFSRHRDRFNLQQGHSGPAQKSGALLLGMLRDKNPSETLAELKRLSPLPQICTLGVPVPRGMDGEAIAEVLVPITAGSGVAPVIAGSPEEGFDWLRKMAAIGEPIAATGSMYLAGMVRQAWLPTSHA
ncbi:MAG: bifunctional folylpolyglutamate synthase/dihydrofolate synthase [Planctomycetota bacterium]